MLNVNQVNLAGNLTRTPELRYTNEAKPKAVCEFGIAVNDRVNDKTTFVDIVVWGKTAEACNKYLGKGSSAYIAGRLQFDQWDNRETGKKASRLRVVAESVQFLDKAPATEKTEAPATQEPKAPAKKAPAKKASAKKAKKTKK